MTIRSRILTSIHELLAEKNIEPKEPIDDNTVLLSTGLDSLGFAVLVVRLELELGFDPFVAMQEPFYPRTLSEFVRMYESYKP